jgi:hypothetical protein
MILNRKARRQVLWALVLAGISGCSGAGVEGTSEGPDLSNMVPVSGVVTLNGEPLAGAVVTFLPPQWSTGIGETDAKGRYSLSYSGLPGLPPGDYKVAVSLLLSAEGEPQGVGPRSSMVPPPGMLSTKEILPPGYADLGRSKLTAHVGQEGGTFDFDVKAPGLVVPTRPVSQAEGADAAGEGGRPAEMPSPANKPNS